MIRILIASPLLFLPHLHAAELSAQWASPSDQQWDNFVNWDIHKVPNNIGGDTFNAFLGGGSGLVFVNISPTIQNLTTQVGADLSISSGFTLTVRDAADNNGVITLEGGNNVARFSVSDSSGDLRVPLSGTGEIVMDHPSDRVGGALNHVLVHQGGHTIRGHGNLGEGAILIENSAFVVADAPGNPLVVQPRGSFLNSGNLWALGGGILDLKAGTYTNQINGELRVGDGSAIHLSSATIHNGAVEVLQQNGIASDNELRVIASSTLFNMRNEAAVFVNDGRALTLRGSEFVNHGPIRLESAANPAQLSFGATAGTAYTLSGNGHIFLDHPSDTVTGSLNHTLTLEAPHVIDGGGRLGVGAISFVNQSSVTANHGTVPLVVQPRSTWTNDGGVLSATDGSVAQLLAGTYRCLNGGRFVVGEDSVMELSSVTAINSPFQIEDRDANPLDHRLVITANSTFDQSSSEVVIEVNDGRTLTVRDDRFTNNSQILLQGGVNASSLSIHGGDDLEMTLGGNGTVFLDHFNDSVSGALNHTLRQEATHRIEGGGRIGLSGISIINHGAMEANLPATPLIVAPRNFMINDGGTLTASSGAMIEMGAASYSVSNGGRYLIADDSSYELHGGTWADLTFEIEDLDLNPLNHFVNVATNTVFRDVTNEAVVTVADGRTLSGVNSLTNNALIQLSGGTNPSSLLLSDPADFVVELGGSGTLELDHPLDRLTGTLNHLLIHEPSHTVSGFGQIGGDQVSIINRGVILANSAGQALVVDPRLTFRNDGGLLRADPNTLIRLRPGTFSSMNGGAYVVGEDAEFSIEGVTLEDMALEADDTDSDPLNHRATVSANSTFRRISNELAIQIDDGQTLSLGGGDFVNMAQIEPMSGVNASRVLIDGTGNGNTISIVGSGTILLDDPLDTVTGALAHLLVHGPDHSITGFGSLGSNSINLVNRGLIISDTPSETLVIDPQVSFVNDGGTLAAADGSIVRLNGGTYSSANGGVFSIGEDALFDLNAVTLQDLTLSADNTVGTAENHRAEVLATSTFRRVTNELALQVADGRQLLLAGGDLINHGSIELNGASNPSAVSINGAGVGNVISILGSGRISLDGGNDQISGSLNHLLIHGPQHVIEGSGMLGGNAIKLRNEGTVHASRAGESLIVDLAGSPVDNRGTIRATGGTLDIRESLTDTGGVIDAEPTGTILVSGSLTQSGGMATANGTIQASSLTFHASQVKGSGLITGPTAAFFSSVTPGNSTGTLTVDGAMTLGSGTSLGIEVGATVDHDVLSVTAGNLILSGSTLRLDYLGGASDVLNSDVLTIATTTGAVTGEFLNAADGDRLYTVDGVASFIVNYEASSITLSEFIHDPSGPANQPPVFSSFVTSVAVDENTPTGSLVATFFAHDPEGVAIEYSIDGGPVPFGIDLLDGELRVTGSLNHEVASSFTFLVRAYDQESYADTEVTISINDLTDTNAEITELLLTQAGGPFEGETDPAIIAYDADPDFDGRANVFELWRGTDPSVTDLPVPLLLERFEVSAEDRGSLVVEVDPVVDDLLFIDPEFSFDLTGWRSAAENRIVVSEAGGVRTLRFFDTLPVVPEGRFFLQFVADGDGER